MNIKLRCHNTKPFVNSTLKCSLYITYRKYLKKRNSQNEKSMYWCCIDIIYNKRDTSLLFLDKRKVCTTDAYIKIYLRGEIEFKLINFHTFHTKLFKSSSLKKFPEISGRYLLSLCTRLIYCLWIVSSLPNVICRRENIGKRV